MFGALIQTNWHRPTVLRALTAEQPSSSGKRMNEPPSATGGFSAVGSSPTGGTIAYATGGSAPTGGRAPTGGQSAATGGTKATGGNTSTGGQSATCTAESSDNGCPSQSPYNYGVQSCAQLVADCGNVDGSTVECCTFSNAISSYCCNFGTATVVGLGALCIQGEDRLCESGLVCLSPAGSALAYGVGGICCTAGGDCGNTAQ